jgi:hypothetical protein
MHVTSHLWHPRSIQIFKLPLQQTYESITILWNLRFGVETNDQPSKEILGQFTWCNYGLKGECIV